MQAFNVSCSSVYFFSICVQGCIPPTPLAKVILVCHFLVPTLYVLSTLRIAEPELFVVPLKAMYTENYEA